MASAGMNISGWGSHRPESGIIMRSVSLLIIALTVTLCGSLCAGPAMADEKGWVLTQRSANFGDQYVYISPTGLKLVSPKQGVNIVTSAPEWNVALFNDKTRMYYSTSFAKWMQELDRKLAGRGQDMSLRKWTKGGSHTVAGLQATQYVMEGGTAQMAKHAAGIRHADCWISNDIAVPPQISQMLAKVYGLPDTRTFPLKVSAVTTSGALTSMLDTYRTQNCPIPVNYFGLPQGYRRADSEAEVMVDDETRQILNDLASDQPSRQSPSPTQTYAQPANTSRFAGQSVQPQPQPQPVPVQQGNNPVTPPVAATPAVVPVGDPSASINFGNGYSLDREKLQRIKEALMNPNKKP